MKLFSVFFPCNDFNNSTLTNTDCRKALVDSISGLKVWHLVRNLSISISCCHLLVVVEEMFETVLILFPVAGLKLVVVPTLLLDIAMAAVGPLVLLVATLFVTELETEAEFGVFEAGAFILQL